MALFGLLVLQTGCRNTPAASPVPTMPHGFVVARPVSPLFDPALAPSHLDTHERDRWQQPARIVDTLHLKKGDAVADIGSGSGYLLPYLSRAVGPSGTVFAEEVQDGYLAPLRERARRLPNVRVVMGTVEDPKLPMRTVDAFMPLRRAEPDVARVATLFWGAPA